jgi:hypothetical protein
MVAAGTFLCPNEQTVFLSHVLFTHWALPECLCCVADCQSGGESEVVTRLTRHSRRETDRQTVTYHGSVSWPLTAHVLFLCSLSGWQMVLSSGREHRLEGVVFGRLFVSLTNI